MSQDADSRGLAPVFIPTLFVVLVVALSLLSYPLAILPREYATHRFDFYFPWTALAAAVCLFGVAFWRTESLRLSGGVKWLAGALLLFLASQGVSAWLSDGETGQFDFLFRSGSGVFLCFVGARFLDSRRLKQFAVAWTLAAAVEAAVMLAQVVCGVEPVGLAGNRNFAACFLAMSLPIGVACAVAFRRQWLLAAAYVMLLCGALWASESRGAAMALLVAALGWLLARSGGRKWWLRAVGVVAVLAGVMLLPPVQNAAKRFWNNDVRPMIWLGSARAMADAPIVGHGPGSFVRVYPAHRPREYFDRPKCALVTDHAHNEFLEIGVETGALGVLAFVALLAVAAGAAHKAVRNERDESLRVLAVGMTMGWGVLLVQNLVDINLFMPPNESLFWLMIAWLVGAAGAGGFAEAGVSLQPAARLIAGVLAALVLAFGVAKPTYANWLFREGSVAQAAGDERGAFQSFLRVVETDPDRVEAWRRAGLAAFKLGKLDAAVAAFRSGHRLMPDYADLNGELGSLLAMKGDFPEAARLLTRAAELYPRDAKNFAKLALVRLSLKETEAARQAFEEAKRLEPNNELVRWVEKKLNQQPESSRVTP
ncbi:MAG: O-antigen ligase family protein [Verrucomicrobia bacterium]|nr:O-antigen ligase family protein [Verrucomicrobiota bacterium]